MLAPMQRWTTAYNTVQTRMTKLEGLRLEVDSRRWGLGLGRPAPAQAAGCMVPGLVNKAAKPVWACLGSASSLVVQCSRQVSSDRIAGDMVLLVTCCTG